jgi:GNAT superfamily N-acetyltransferase
MPAQGPCSLNFGSLFRSIVQNGEDMAVSDIRIRFATPDDAGLLLQLIRELAAYERAPNAVVATEEDLRRYGFGPERQFEALLAFLDDEPAGLALFYPRFSTWLGRPGVYLEDLFVAQAARGKGVGRRLMTRLAAISVERGWERIDFQVLDWNPARDFYRRLGIDHLGAWLRYGGDATALRRLAAEDSLDWD